MDGKTAERDVLTPQASDAPTAGAAFGAEGGTPAEGSASPEESSSR